MKKSLLITLVILGSLIATSLISYCATIIIPPYAVGYSVIGAMFVSWAAIHIIISILRPPVKN